MGKEGDSKGKSHLVFADVREVDDLKKLGYKQELARVSAESSLRSVYTLKKVIVERIAPYPIQCVHSASSVLFSSDTIPVTLGELSVSEDVERMTSLQAT